MKTYLFLISFILSLSSFGASTNSALVLRAIVPPVIKVEVKMDKTGPRAVFHSNLKGHKLLPKAFIYKKDTHYLVSITHP